MIKGSNNRARFGSDVKRCIDLLSREIYSGSRLPGARLVESELMTSFNLTRSKVRQVLAELESFGLVNIIHNKGATVADITIRRIQEIYQIVGILEGAATRLATERIEKKDVLKLRSIIDKQRQIGEKESRRWRKLNNEFHRSIILKCDNSELINTIRVFSHFANYWFSEFTVPPIQQNINDHEQITEMLVNKDSFQAGALMEKHIVQGGNFVIEYLEKNLPFILIRKSG